MSNIKASNIKKGSYLLHLNQPHYVISRQFASHSRGSAFSRCKMRNVATGANVEFTFKSHDQVEELDVESKEMQFLYHDGDNIVFMDPISYDQVEIPAALLKEQVKMLVPELKAYVLFYEEKAIGVSLPPKVKMKVKEAEEAIAGDRQNAGKKPVTMETGLIVQVPLFIKKEEVLIVDTESGNYVSRG
jgi:elongation factor P